MTSEEFLRKVEEDRAASFVLQRTMRVFAERDVLDSLIDAEALLQYCTLRAREAGIK